MTEFNEKLQELKEKIVCEFDTYKDFNDYKEADPIRCKDLDYLLFKIKYQIDQVKKDSCGKTGDGSIGTKDVDLQKADSLIKLQSLLSIITCHVLNLEKKLRK